MYMYIWVILRFFFGCIVYFYSMKVFVCSLMTPSLIANLQIILFCVPCYSIYLYEDIYIELDSRQVDFPINQ